MAASLFENKLDILARKNPQRGEGPRRGRGYSARYLRRGGVRLLAKLSRQLFNDQVRKRRIQKV